MPFRRTECESLLVLPDNSMYRRMSRTEDSAFFVKATRSVSKNKECMSRTEETDFTDGSYPSVHDQAEA